MKSAILNEDRRVLVHVPASYDTSGKSYPVLYLLDGTQAFLLEMIGITNRLRNDRNAPEVIIVAIENTNRDRDMMPVVAKDLPGQASPQYRTTQHLDRMALRSDNQVHHVETWATQREAWIRVRSQWFLWRVDQVRNQRRLVDGRPD